MKHNFLAVCTALIFLIGFLATDASITGHLTQEQRDNWRPNPFKLQSPVHHTAAYSGPVETAQSNPDILGVKNLVHHGDYDPFVILTSKRTDNRVLYDPLGAISSTSDVQHFAFAKTPHRTGSHARVSKESLSSQQLVLYNVDRDPQGIIGPQDLDLLSLAVSQAMRSSTYMPVTEYNRYVTQRKLPHLTTDHINVDINQDGRVSWEDLSLFMGTFGETSSLIPSTRKHIEQEFTCSEPGRVICSGIPFAGRVEAFALSDYGARVAAGNEIFCYECRESYAEYGLQPGVAYDSHRSREYRKYAYYPVTA